MTLIESAYRPESSGHLYPIHEAEKFNARSIRRLIARRIDRNSFWAFKQMTQSDPDIDTLKLSLLASFPATNLHDHPIVFGELSLRFELGDPHPNGSDARIRQSTSRALQLYHDVFPSRCRMMLVIDDWDSSGNELWPSNPVGYLYSLIAGFNVDTAEKERLSSDESSHDRFMIVSHNDAIDCENVFRGIANREQGQVPRINESVYFIDIANGVAFYMYDDRGCLVYFTNSDVRNELRELRKDWLVRH